MRQDKELTAFFFLYSQIQLDIVFQKVEMHSEHLNFEQSEALKLLTEYG